MKNKNKNKRNIQQRREKKDEKTCQKVNQSRSRHERHPFPIELV